LAGIDRDNELVVIFRPLSINYPAGDLIAIAGNMSGKKREPAFIKINKDCTGFSFVIQNHRKIPLTIHPKIPLPAKLLYDTTWDNAQEGIAFAAIPNMVPIPFGAVIPDGVTHSNEFIKAFLAISPKHCEWAKLIYRQANQAKQTG
jgi:hypothetical protein